MTISVDTAMERMLASRSRRSPMAPLSESAPDLSVTHAYAMQDALRADFVRRGAAPIGWKLGATSAAGQAVMGVTEPACGLLLPERYDGGADVSLGRFADLRVEAEVVFRMGKRLGGPGVTAEAALDAVAAAGAPKDVDLSREEVVYEHNGEIVGRYSSAEVMGNPLNALAWLANHLPTRGLALEP
jgi:2-keto-4-pentenoate hydratase